MLNARVKKLVSSLPEGFEAALVQTEASRFYLLDFDAGDAGTLLLFPDEMVYFIDTRYMESATAQVKNAKVVLEEDVLAQVGALLAKNGVKTLLLENEVSVALCERIKEKLPEVCVDASFLLSRALRNQRMVKDEEEIARMRKAQRITDACFVHILPFIKEGVLEQDLMLEMEHFMRSNGAQKIAFDTILLAGTKTSLPHGTPGENRVKNGDFITMDFGARYKGYCSDMTRTVAFGEPGEKKREVYNLVLRAHLAGIEAVCAGKKGNEVDKVARDIIYAAGYSGCFGHGLGHAVGIDIHEDPRFSPKCSDEILAGMMMTVEPGCYLPGEFGCRIEDMVLVGETGCEPLPTCEKQLIVL